MAEVRDAETNEVTYRATADGAGVPRPGEGQVARAERALDAAAAAIVTQVVRAEATKARVMGSPKPGVLIIDRGSRDGLIAGTELDIIHRGRRIGSVRVDNVKEATSTGRVFDMLAGASVDAGDELRVVSIPSAPDKVKTRKKKSSNKTAKIIGAVLVVGLLVALLSGGGGGGGGGTGTITAVPTDTSIPADGVSSTNITVTLADRKGNPFPDGTPVEFRTDLGLIAPGRVDLATGVAQATLVASTTPGRATVTVIAKGNRTTTTVDFIQAAGGVTVTTLTVLSADAELPADGLSTTKITAIAGDPTNNAVPDGTEVTFSTSLGLVSPAVGVTDAGVVEAELRSGTTDGAATVTVTSGGVTRTVVVDFVPSGTGGTKTLFLTRSSDKIPADGLSTVQITATVKNASNNPVKDGTPVNFTGTAGTIFPARAATTNGVANATLRADPAPDQATVTAKVGSTTATVTVAFVDSGGGAISSIFVTRTPAEIPGDGTSTATVIATVRDPNNNPVADGTQVVFTTSRGIISPSISQTTGGTAEAEIRSEPTSTDTTATITVVAGTQQAITTVKFTGTGSGPTRISVTADRTNIPADGTSTSALRALLLDPSGQPIPATSLTLSATSGMLSTNGGATYAATVTGTTDALGFVNALLQSTAAPNTSTVTVAAPTVTTDTAAVTISFTALVITSVTADPASVPVGGNNSSTVTATVVDTAGNPAPDGTVVKFSLVNQAVLPAATITNSASTAGGLATAVFRSGTNVGTAQIRVEVVSSGAVNDQTIIGITAGPAALITAGASRFVTSARTVSPGSPVVITALVSDQFDNPVEDATAVRFDVTPDQGAVITGTSTTSGGFASANLFPTGFVGDVQVTVSTTGAGGVTVDNSASPVSIHMGGAPVTVTIISPSAAATSPATPFTLFHDADQTIVVQLIDISGGPADPNAQVTFQASRGVVSPDPADITAPLAGTATAALQSDQPSLLGTTETLVAVSEGVSSAPLHYVVEINPAP